MNKTKKLEIRIEERLLQDLKKLADINEITVSEYVRCLIVADREYEFSIEGIDELTKKHGGRINELRDIAKDKIKEANNKIKELEIESKKWKGVLSS